ncbi:hypothetical protein OC861_006301 [Tilletia horrida]|nr:hypothetical protein OC861_006301 [Tilletia horrida]
MTGTEQGIGSAPSIQRPGLSHVTSYNSQLDFLLRGAALQAQDRALNHSSASSSSAQQSRRRRQRREGQQIEQDDPANQSEETTTDEEEDTTDDDEVSSNTSTDTDTTSDIPHESTAGFDSALAASTATLGPSATYVIVPNLGTLPDNASIGKSIDRGRTPTINTYFRSPSSSRLDVDSPLQTPRLTLAHDRIGEHHRNNPLRSWSGSYSPSSIRNAPRRGNSTMLADRALEDAATLYALASASSTTSLTRKRGPRRRNRTLSTATLRTPTNPLSLSTTLLSSAGNDQPMTSPLHLTPGGSLSEAGTRKSAFMLPHSSPPSMVST